MTSNQTEQLERTAHSNGRWLREAMAPYFFAAMQDEPEAIANLERGLGTLRSNQHLILADRPNALILAAPNTPGSLYRTITLGAGSTRAISYAMFAHSDRPMPGMAATLEEIWTRFNPYDTHGVTNDMTKDQLNDLIEYLKTL